MVVVNILAPVIIAMFQQDELLSYVGENGRLILSGIIEVQGNDVEAALAAAGGYVVEKVTDTRLGELYRGPEVKVARK
ncbi:MAG: 50S ribosomal protein L11 methyltransferase [Chloroflexi bacterium]|nr:50S ribosomal protein L11 methyltransferase [Chloroflexota bacterium]